MPQLLIVDPRGGEQRVRLDRTEYTLGRDPSVSIPLQDAKVSRKHARIVHDGTAFWIEDLGSANGVIIRGRAITRPRKLTPGIEIDIGGFLLVFEAEAAGGVSVSLVGLTPPYQGQSFMLPDGVLEIGRVEGSAIVIPDPSVSRKHATLAVGGSATVVEDLDSANGTFVNGVRVGRRQIEPGDRVRFGNVEFEYVRAGHTSGLGTLGILWTRLARADPSIQITLGIALLSLLLLVITIAVAVRRAQGPAPRQRAAKQSLEAVYARAIETGVGAAKQHMQREAWDEAAQAYQEVLDRDPIHSEARDGLIAAQRNAADKKTLDTAAATLQAGRAADALSLARSIAADAYYGPAAHEVAQQARIQIAASALDLARSACSKREWKSCHTHAARVLEATLDSVEGRALVTEAESAMRTRRIPFTPWSKPITEKTGAPAKTLDEIYPDADVRSAAVRYAAGDLGEAIKIARTHTSRPGAKALNASLVAFRDAQTKGNGAAASGMVERAVADWEKALTADAKILPEPHPSVFRDQVRRRIGVAMFRQGDAAFGRGVYPEAYRFWALGLRHNAEDPELLGGVTRLEKRAENALADMPANKALGATNCAKLREILAMTRPTSEVHQEAKRRKTRHCRR